MILLSACIQVHQPYTQILSFCTLGEGKTAGPFTDNSILFVMQHLLPTLNSSFVSFLLWAILFPITQTNRSRPSLFVRVTSKFQHPLQTNSASFSFQSWRGSGFWVSAESPQILSKFLSRSLHRPREPNPQPYSHSVIAKRSRFLFGSRIGWPSEASSSDHDGEQGEGAQAEGIQLQSVPSRRHAPPRPASCHQGHQRGPCQAQAHHAVQGIRKRREWKCWS